MKTDELIALVEEMRTEQKAYFRTREPIHLSHSKELERRVDRAIAEFKDKQGKLFG